MAHRFQKKLGINLKSVVGNNMKKEQKINIPGTQKDLKSELQKKGFLIEKAQLPEDEPMQCKKCMKEDNFEFHNEGWFVEGEFYCGGHKEYILNILKQIDEDAARIKKEREEIIKKRQETSGF